MVNFILLAKYPNIMDINNVADELKHPAVELKDKVDKIQITSTGIIAFDFDELLVPIHLSRTITDNIAAPDEEKLNLLGNSTRQGIEYIRSLFTGYDYLLYEELRNDIVSKTPLRSGVKELIEYLSANYTIIVITSGLKDIAQCALGKLVPEENIIGGELDVVDNKITGPGFVITEGDKAEVINILSRHCNIAAVGHSASDQMMLDASNISISFGPDCKAKYQIDDLIQIKDIIFKEWEEE